MSSLKTFSFVLEMINKAKILTLLIGFLVWACGCGNKTAESPYSGILDQAPYRALTDSIRDEPGKAELYFKRAVLLNQNELIEPALADFNRAWTLHPEEKYALGVSTIWLEKNPDSAIIFLDKALKQFPQSFLLQLGLARAYVAKNRLDEALIICEQVLETNPGHVDVLKMKADLLDKKGNTEEAISTLEKAYQLTPYDVELNYILALKYAETKNSRVLRLCDSLIRKDSAGARGEPYYYKGIYYSNLGQRSAALEQFNQAIQRDFYLLDAYIEKGSILYDQKKFREALTVFQLANNISATFPDAYYWMGKSQEALGQKAEAKLNYERALGLDKSFIKAKEAAERLR